MSLRIIYIASVILLMVLSITGNAQSKSSELIREISKSKPDTSKVLLLGKLIDNLLKENNSSEALVWIRQSEELSKKLNYQRGISGTTFRLARYYESQNELIKADSLLDVSKTQYSELKGYTKIRNNNIIAINSTKANIKEKLGMIDEAEAIHLNNIKFAESIKDTNLLISLYLNLMNLYMDRDQKKESYKLRVKMEDMISRSSDKMQAVMMLNNIGLMEQKHGDNKEAAKKFNESIRLAYASGNSPALMLLNLANCYMKEKDNKETYRYLDSAMMEAKKSSDVRTIGLVFGNYGNIYRENGQLDSALLCYQRTIPIFEQTYDANGTSISHRNIGLIYKQKKDYKKAIQYFRTSYDIAIKNQLARPATLALNSLSSTYELMNDFKNAYLYNKLYSRLKDSLDNKTKQEELNSLITKVALERQKTELKAAAKYEKEMIQATNAAKLEQEHQKKIFLFIGLGLLSFFLFFLFNRFRIIKRQKEIIEKQKLIVDEKQKEILDSINYAKRIQQSLLPAEKIIEKHLDRLNEN